MAVVRLVDPIICCMTFEESPTLWPLTVTPVANCLRMFASWIS